MACYLLFAVCSLLSKYIIGNTSVTIPELELNRDEVQILLYYKFSVKMNSMFFSS